MLNSPKKFKWKQFPPWSVLERGISRDRNSTAFIGWFHKWIREGKSWTVAELLYKCPYTVIPKLESQIRRPRRRQSTGPFHIFISLTMVSKAFKICISVILVSLILCLSNWYSSFILQGVCGKVPLHFFASLVLISSGKKVNHSSM